MLAKLTILILGGVTLAAPRKRDFGPVTIFSPPSNYETPQTLYARGLRLQDASGTLLSTWENYTPNDEMPYFPIYTSTDAGYDWEPLSTVQDTVNGWGLRYQPHMIQLDAAIGNYPAGTVLIAGNSIPSDYSQTQLDLYASTDSGQTWAFVSHIASGGAANTDDGQTPVWEPFLMVYQGQLICYYSDQRDSAYSQKISYQTTTDLVNWGDQVDAVTESTQTDRPGMPVVAAMGNGQYLLSYEFGGAPEADFAAYYKITSDPLDFGSVNGQALVTADGYVPTSAPYSAWTNIGSDSGTVVMTAASDSDLFLNQDYGQGSWTRLTCQLGAGYSRNITIGGNPKDLVILNGGPLGENNTVQMAARDVNGCSYCS